VVITGGANSSEEQNVVIDCQSFLGTWTCLGEGVGEWRGDSSFFIPFITEVMGGGAWKRRLQNGLSNDDDICLSPLTRSFLCESWYRMRQSFWRLLLN
jgi:hypothetical protein